MEAGHRWSAATHHLLDQLAGALAGGDPVEIGAHQPLGGDAVVAGMLPMRAMVIMVAFALMLRLVARIRLIQCAMCLNAPMGIPCLPNPLGPPGRRRCAH